MVDITNKLKELIGKEVEVLYIHGRNPKKVVGRLVEVGGEYITLDHISSRYNEFVMGRVKSIINVSFIISVSELEEIRVGGELYR